LTADTAICPVTESRTRNVRTSAGIRARKLKPTKTSGYLKNAENERDKTIPTENVDVPPILEFDDRTGG
jgi:hypothetical protein